MKRLIALLIAAAGLMPAQSSGGTISGTVRDASGAVIPNVPVAITHVETIRNRMARPSRTTAVRSGHRRKSVIPARRTATDQTMRCARISSGGTARIHLK